MSKRPLKLDTALGDIRKEERQEPATVKPRTRRPKVKKAVNERQLATRVSEETDEQINFIMTQKNCTMKEVIRMAIDELYKKTK